MAATKARRDARRRVAHPRTHATRRALRLAAGRADDAFGAGDRRASRRGARGLEPWS